MDIISVELNHDQDQSIDRFVSIQLNKVLSEITIADIEQYLAKDNIKYDYVRFRVPNLVTSVITGPMDKINWFLLCLQ